MIMEHNTSTSICEIFWKKKGLNIVLYIVTLLGKLELLREKNKYLHEEAHAITFSMNIPKHLQAENWRHPIWLTLCLLEFCNFIHH